MKIGMTFSFLYLLCKGDIKMLEDVKNSVITSSGVCRRVLILTDRKKNKVTQSAVEGYIQLTEYFRYQGHEIVVLDSSAAGLTMNIAPCKSHLNFVLIKGDIPHSLASVDK